ncbi:hypothetical protein CDD83_8417 [Cordyceps sp. RAO-2017]|nr:hypothetical protein CDD83_8417 [Cordyceps sp. RAO-2017]
MGAALANTRLLLSSHKSNSARIRDNQRRSRARRREYIKELEQRLRRYESQRSTASAEMQMAARRVDEENKQLRELLNQYGISDHDIADFLQSGTFMPLNSEQGHPFRADDPGAALQSLQQLPIPRPLASQDQGFSPSFPRQSNREPSTPGRSITASSAWEPSQLATSSYIHQDPMGVATAVIGSAIHCPYPPTALLSCASTTRQGRVYGRRPFASTLNSSSQPLATTRAMFIDGRPAMHSHYSLPTYSDSTIPQYDSPGGSTY